MVQVKMGAGHYYTLDFTANRDFINVSSFGSTKPDPKWVETDAKKHVHAWVSEDVTWAWVNVPSAHECHEDCEDDCDDDCCTYTQRVATCLICRDEITPARISSSLDNRSLAGPTRYVIVVNDLQIVGDCAREIRYRSEVSEDVYNKFVQASGVANMDRMKHLPVTESVTPSLALGTMVEALLPRMDWIAESTHSR